MVISMTKRRVALDLKTRVFSKIFGEPWTRCSIFEHGERSEPDYCSGAEGLHEKYGCNHCRLYTKDWGQKMKEGYEVL